MVLPILGIAAAALAPLPPLHVQGRKLLDPQGKEVLLKGANVGNWHVIEFWMLALDGKKPADQFDLEATLSRRFGEKEKDRLMDVYRSSWLGDRDFKIIPTFGFNCVRLPTQYRLMEDDRNPYHLRKDAWKWLDRAIDLAERNRLYTIIDMHGVQGGQNVNDHTGHAGQNHIKDSLEDQKRLAWLWGEIAKRYRDRSAVAAYDVWNEPYNTPKPLHKPIFERSYRAIRAVDKDKLVWAMGNYDTFDEYGDPKTNGWRNVGFEMHYYPGLFGGGEPTVQTQAKHLASLTAVERKVVQLDVPFYVGEMNVVFDRAGGADMMRRTYDLHASYGWATTMWSYKLETQEGGIGDAFWGMVANAKPAPQIDFAKDSEAAVEAYFRSFATQELTVNEPLRKALADPNYHPAPLPETPSRRTVAPQESLAGWKGADVGNVLRGGLQKTAEGFALYGGGNDIWGERDEFRFLNRPVEGEQTLEATLSSVEDLETYTKAGLMLRASSAADAPFVLLSVTPSGELQLAHRDVIGGTVTAPPTGKGELPLHLRLVRKGGEVSAFVLRGNTWAEFSSVRDGLPRSVLAGVIACSHDEASLVKVDYRDLRLSAP